MSDNALVYTPCTFTHNLNCPQLVPQPYSLPESLPFLWRCLVNFSNSHCKNNCAFCTSKHPDLFTYFPEVHENLFYELHLAFSHLPQEHQDNLFAEAGFECPACAILKALQCFPLIAESSVPKPVNQQTMFEDGKYVIKTSIPCFPDFIETIIGVYALERFDATKLVILPPPIQRQLRPLVENGQGVIRYIQELRKSSEDPSSSKNAKELYENTSNAGLSNQDVYYIFGVFPEDFTIERPTVQFMNWVKSEIFNNNGDYCKDYQYLERIIRISYYFESCTKSKALMYDRVRSSFINAWAACNKSASDYSFHKMLDAGIHQAYLQIRGENTPEKRIVFSFLGRKRWFNGNPPTTFKDLPHGCIPDMYPSFFGGNTKHSRVANQTISASIDNKPIAQSAAKSDATGTGIGVGEGGDGGNAEAISAPVVTAAPVAKIEDGANRNTNTFTNNIAGQGDVVRETTDAVFRMLEWVKDNPGVVLGTITDGKIKSNGAGGRKDGDETQEKADAVIWDEWEQAKSAKILKAKFAADKGMTENEVQNALDRHRKRL